MAAAGDLPSSSPSRMPEGSLAYYKSQYEQLEAELADFQASSKELEAELEKDVEAAEKRERQLQEKAEALTYEVEEWKTKYKQAKIESNNAHNTLQKEITILRDTNRTIQAKLRDIEVSNDNYERQARNTTSSLEDLESKYNIAIERGVLTEEDIRAGEQEREALRIETQRLRDELSDLKIEAEIRQDKLYKAEAKIEGLHRIKSAPISAGVGASSSPPSELSPTTTNSSPTLATPPTKSTSSVSETATPPSPPSSDKSAALSRDYVSATEDPKTTTSLHDTNITPRPSHVPAKSATTSSRRLSIPVSTDQTPQGLRRAPVHRSGTAPRQGLPHSGSLHHLHGLMNKMQLLEQRVHSVRSKLPAPTSTPPRGSPRSASSLAQPFIPATVTVRSSKRRTGGSNASSAVTPSDRPGSRLSSAYTHAGERSSSRLSFGIPIASPKRESILPRPPSRDPQSSRPSSRTSLTSRQSISHLPSAASGSSSTSRPTSRQSVSGARTPLGHYSSHSQSESRRPRSSLSGSFAVSHGHVHSASVSRLGHHNPQASYGNEEDDEVADVLTPTPSRRGTYISAELATTNIIAPAPPPKSRMSGTGMVSGRRISSGGDMAPPERKMAARKLSEVGESY